MKYSISRMDKNEKPVNEALDEVIEAENGSFAILQSNHKKNIEPLNLIMSKSNFTDKNGSYVMVLPNGDCIFADAEAEEV